MNHDDLAAKAVEAAAQRILEEAAIARSRTEHLGRRLNLALYDLGISGITGRDWTSGDEEQIHFASLDHRTVQRLVVVLRDLADGRSRPVAQPGRGQIGFSFTPRPLLGTGGSPLHVVGGVA